MEHLPSTISDIYEPGLMKCTQLNLIMKYKHEHVKNHSHDTHFIIIYNLLSYILYVISQEALEASLTELL